MNVSSSCDVDFEGTLWIKSLTNRLLILRLGLRRTPFLALFYNSTLFNHYVKRIRKNNIFLPQTLSIIYLYQANARIVYDIFPYAHSPQQQQPVVLLPCASTFYLAFYSSPTRTETSFFARFSQPFLPSYIYYYVLRSMWYFIQQSSSKASQILLLHFHLFYE